MSLRIPAGGISLRIGADGAAAGSAQVLLRLDLWPTWLEIGCHHAREAERRAAEMLALDPDVPRGPPLLAELRDAMVSICSLAFAIDAFYDFIQAELGPHPDAQAWRRKRTARYRQIAETIRYHLKVGPKSTAQLRDVLRQLMSFRDRAVHPSSKPIEPTYRDDVDAGVHPAFLTFSGTHAVSARRLTLSLFDQLLLRAAEVLDLEDDNWIRRARQVLDPLTTEYLVGDQSMATDGQGL